MFDGLKNLFGGKPAKVEEEESLGRIVEVGWVVDTDKSEFIYDNPEQYSRTGARPNSPKAVQMCPAVIDYESRHFIVPCPVDIKLRINFDGEGKPSLVNTLGPNATIYKNKLEKMVHLTDPKQWRRPDRPVVQVGAPYRFLCDETCYMMQIPPIFHYRDNPLPGVMISGRLPIHIWPRIMMWAFEWYDTSKELVLKRGEPWFGVYFELPDPTRKVRLVHAAMTPELRHYCNGIDGVANYVNRTYSLFETAKSRRPKKLLVPFDSADFNQAPSNPGNDTGVGGHGAGG